MKNKIKILGILGLLSLLIIPTMRIFSAIGDMTISFSNTTNGQINTAVRQSDGKIILAGTFTTFNGTSTNRIVRINTNGTLDTGFTVGSGFNTEVKKLLLQADGKIVAMGDFTTYNGTSRNRVARLNADGTLDTGFTVGSGFSIAVRDGVLQSDGKIVVIAPGATTYNGTAIGSGIARLNTDGTLDTAYTTNTGSGFTGIAPYYGSPFAIAKMSNDKIVIVGAGGAYDTNTNVGVVLLNTDGTFDTTFGTNLGTGLNDIGYSVAVQSDDKIVIAGSFTDFDGTARNRLLRLNADGTLDTGFSVGTGLGSYAESIYIDIDNKIVLVGANVLSYNGNSVGRIVRINSNGSYDSTFIGGSGFNSSPLFVTKGAPGKILVGGSFTTYKGTTTNKFAVITTIETPAPAVAPDLDINNDSGTNDTDNITNDTQLYFNGTCTNGDIVTLYIDTVASGTPVTCTSSTYQIDAGTISTDGVKNIAVSFTRNSVESILGPALSVTIDRTALPPTITSPASGQYSGSSPVTVTGNCETGAQVTINPGAVTATCSAGTFSGNVTYTTLPITINAAQADIAGNTSTTSTDVTLTTPTSGGGGGSSTGGGGGGAAVLILNTQPNPPVNTEVQKEEIIETKAEIKTCEPYIGKIRENGRLIKSEVQKIQTFLNEKTGSNLVIDGVYGPKSRNAMRTYQRNNKLIATGLISTRVVHVINVEMCK